MANAVDVFHFLFDPKNINRWIENVEYVSHRPAGPLGQGSEIACNISFLGIRTFATYRILSMAVGEYYVGAGGAGAIKYGDRFDFFQSQKTGQTDVRWRLSIQYPSIMRIGVRFIRKTIEQEQANKLFVLSALFSGKAV